MIARGELSIERKAESTTPAVLRHALEAFLTALEVPNDLQIDVITAAGEAFANVVEHAYRDGSIGEIGLTAKKEHNDVLTIDVIDKGTFIEPSASKRPVNGFGLRIIRSTAHSVNIDTGSGTAIRMIFNIPH